MNAISEAGTGAAWHRVERLWPGATVVIIGGGASLTGFDWPAARRLIGDAGARIVALNDAWRCLAADVLYFGDARFWRWQGTDILAAHRGVVATRAALEPGACETWDRMTATGRTWRLRWHSPPALPDRAPRHVGLTDDRKAVAGRFAGHCGLNLLAHLTGAGGRAVLLGFDGRPSGTMEQDGVTVPRGNYHDRHRVAWHPDNFAKSVTELRTTAAPLEALGIEVINATPGSAIDWWPRASLGDALRR